MVKPVSKRPSFFKVMIGDFKSTLRIPPSFSKHLRGNIGVKSVLRGPCGKQWSVSVSRAGDDRWLLRNGWEGFVKDLAIGHGDFLVFYYNGDFVFDVEVYGKTGCKKEEESVFTAASTTIVAKDFRSMNAAGKKNRNKRGKGKQRQGKPIYIGRTSRGLIQLNRPLSLVEKLTAFEEACALKPPNPHFVAACRFTRNYFLTIPNALVKEYQLCKKAVITLQDPQQRKWPIRVSRLKDGRVNLATGWSEFLRENLLREGDACCFEFIQGGDLVHVHLFPEKGVRTERVVSVKKEDESIQSLKRRPPTEHEKEWVMHAARSFRSDYPSFVHLWKLSRSRMYVTVPRNLVKQLNLKTQTKLSLYSPCGRAWPVQIKVWANGNTDIGKGWARFSRDNRLWVGDACVFEFLHVSVVQVHIFRAREASSPPTDKTSQL